MTTEKVAQERPAADSLADVGSGLLGFSRRPLAAADLAYYKALGLTEEAVMEVANELREGMSPLTRAPRG